MEEKDKLISLWKSQTIPEIEATKQELFANKSNTMNTIIHFEQTEKNEKKKQIFAKGFLIILTVILLYKVELNTTHFVGLLLLVLASAWGIISNRTDNFPDLKQHDTIDYLKKFQENTKARNRMHIRNSLIGLPFGVAGLYLTFRHSFDILGNWWMPIMAASAGFTTYMWFKHYNQRSSEVQQEVSQLIRELEE